MGQELIKAKSVKDLVTQPAVRERLKEIMGERGAQFASALVNITRNSFQLQKCEPSTVLGSAFQAASLDLSVDPNIGEAHLVPYGETCTLQIGYLGLAQLALRSGQYRNLGWMVVHEGELVEWDELSGVLTVNKASKVSEKVIGYAAKFRLLNGFERGHYMSVEDVTEHAKKFSKSYAYGLRNPAKKDSPWFTNFDRMALKTVLKMLLKLWGPKSIQMQKALVVDEGAIRDGDTENPVVYPDNASGIPGATRPEFGDTPQVTTDEPPMEPVTETPPPAPTAEPPSAPAPASAASPKPPTKRKATAPVAAPTPAPAEPPAPAAPTPAPAAAAQPTGTYNYVKAVKGLCDMKKIEVSTLLNSCIEIGSVDPDTASLEELAMNNPAMLKLIHDQFDDIVSRIIG